MMIEGCRGGSNQREKVLATSKIGVRTGMLLAVVLAAPAAFGNEVCRFAGTTDYSGQAAITTNVATTGDVTRVDVAITFHAKRLYLIDIQYLLEEVSTWRAGALQSVSVNNRYAVDDHIVRQLWDDFQRGSDGLQARRVQAKTLDDLRRMHPHFVQHWDPVTFGRPWLQDYTAAPPERRTDLDLPSPPAGVRSPLALAFYWIRWLPNGGADVPVFLPGWKKDKVMDVRFDASPSPAGTVWHVPLHHPSLTSDQLSSATALTSTDHHLMRLSFDLHGPAGSAGGLVEQRGCVGSAGTP